MAGAIMSSTNQSWLTPPRIIQPVLRVFGEIDLDPCASGKGWVPAKNVYTGPKAWGGDGKDGLSEPWDGRVFVNPPYGRNDPHPEICGGRPTSIADWLEKCRVAAQAGADVIAIVPAAVETKFWFKNVWGHATVCFLNGRVTFYRWNENNVAVPADSCIPRPIAVLYYGEKYQGRFCAEFGKLGYIP